MTISREIDQFTDAFDERAGEFVALGKVLAGVFIAELVLLIVILVLCAVIAARVKR